MDNTQLFIQHLTNSQARLYAYVRTLAFDADIARDILQNTNLVLWEKSDEFDPDTDFGAWACRVAHFQFLAWRRDHLRERVVFDEELTEQLAQAAEKRSADSDDLQQALRECLTKLSPMDRSLLRDKYSAGVPVKSIAAEQRRTPNAVSRALYRVRRTLLTCIERTLGRECRV